ncbi:MAG TPA: glycosyltransferase, partial [Spirochaetota bacterium]|nr:glycosyltransferase [Spirochaetota bacterium]
MKILVLTKLYPAKYEPNKGIFNKVFIDFFLEYYKNEDISIDLIRAVPIFKKNLETECKINDKLTLHYPKIVTFGKYFTEFHHIFYFHKIINYIKRIKLNFDIIHSHWLYPDCFVATKIGKILNKPVIVHFHGSDINQILENKKLQKYNEYTLYNSNKIVVVSSALKNKILYKYPDLRDKIEVIYNGVDFNKFQNFSSDE